MHSLTMMRVLRCCSLNLSITDPNGSASSLMYGQAMRSISTSIGSTALQPNISKGVNEVDSWTDVLYAYVQQVIPHIFLLRNELNLHVLKSLVESFVEFIAL